MYSVWESNDNHGIGHIQDIPTRATAKEEFGKAYFSELT